MIECFSCLQVNGPIIESVCVCVGGGRGGVYKRKLTI